MERAFARALYDDEEYYPTVRAELIRHLHDVLGVNDDLDLGDLLMEHYIELDRQSQDPGQPSLFQQIMQERAWGTVELAEVMAILWDVQVLIWHPQFNDGTVEWHLQSRGRPGARQVGIVNWVNSHHWTAVVPFPGTPAYDPGLTKDQMDPYEPDHPRFGGPTPIIDRSRFVRRVAPSMLSIGNLDRRPEPQQREQEHDDHDIAAASMEVSCTNGVYIGQAVIDRSFRTRLSYEHHKFRGNRQAAVTTSPPSNGREAHDREVAARDVRRRAVASGPNELFRWSMPPGIFVA